MHIDVFIDGHKQTDVIEDRVNFLKTTQDLKPYMVEFEDDKNIKVKVY